jgi:hypothetical protein
MARTSIWNTQHIDHLQGLLAESLSDDQLATKMSKQFGYRITARNVSALLQRMRKPSDPFYRNIPYRKRGARYGG